MIHRSWNLLFNVIHSPLVDVCLQQQKNKTEFQMYSINIFMFWDWLFFSQLCSSVKHKVKRSSRSRTYRFDDPFLLGATVLPGLAEHLDVLRQDEGSGEKAELLFAMANPHLGQVPPQPVLPANLEGSWEVIQLGRKKHQHSHVKFKSGLKI